MSGECLMSFTRRLNTELRDIHEASLPYFTNVKVHKSTFLTWYGMVLPCNEPYNQGAFWVEINFPPEYPFKPPLVTFKTKIYHPNIGEDGQICMPMLNPENWKSTTKFDQIVEALVATVNSPQPENSLRPELAEEYVKNRKKFNKIAEKFTLQYAEKRQRFSDK